MPGVYADERGGLHIVLPELLHGAGYDDTPENRATLLDAAREIFGPITICDDGYTCPRCGRTSFNQNDKHERYCGACHRFEGDA